MTQQGRIFIDHTHCSRHVTGLERITLEQFSQDALAPLRIEPIVAKTRAQMILRQMLQLPLQTLMTPGSLLICPGFPPAPLATLMGARVLPYIHDLFLLTRGQDLNVRAKLFLRAPFAFAVRQLPRFMVNSQTTARELRRFCRKDAEILLYRPRVRNVFGLSHTAGQPRDGLRLVALGTLEPRKNLMATAQILAALRARGVAATLDIVGRPGWGVDPAGLAIIPGVTVHGYQPVDRVRGILAASDALISTAHDEGLGLPLLEAQYAGLAVIAPKKPVFHEVLAASGLFIDPAAPQDAANRILAMTTTLDWRQRRAQMARENLTRWNSQAARDRDAIVQTIARLVSPYAAQAEVGPAC